MARRYLGNSVRKSRAIARRLRLCRVLRTVATASSAATSTIASPTAPESFPGRRIRVMISDAISLALGCIHIQPGRVRKVHRIVLHVGITIETLWIRLIVATVVRIRLIEARVISIVAPEHGFIARVAVALITRVLVRLERSSA